MSATKLRRVKLARLHQVIQVVGYGQMGGAQPITPSNPTPGKPALELFVTERDSLIIKSKLFEVLVPSANVSMMILEPVELPKQAAPKDPSAKADKGDT
jgi:hypothetical protein